MRSLFTSSRSPTSSQLTVSTSIRISLIAEGWTSLRAFSKSSLITCRESRTPTGISGSLRLILGKTHRRALTAASLHREAISAPANTYVIEQNL